ncbi:MAG: PKD domain-containing protein [Paludibacter sp.]
MKLKLLFILLLISGFAQAEIPVVQWARSFGGTNDDIPASIATDKFGNVYVAGYFNGESITFDSIKLTEPDAPNYNMFLVKYDLNGNVLWAKRSNGTYDSSDVTSMVTDSSGNIYVSGIFNRSTITFGKFVLNNENAGNWSKIFLVKYDSLGNVLWAKTSLNKNGESSIRSVCTDKYGYIYATGYFRSDSLTLDSITLINNGGFYADIFFAKYDPDGNVLFAKSFGSNNVELGCSITTSSKGNIFVAGQYYNSQLTIGSTTLINKINDHIPSSDIFIAKFDKWGDAIWAKSAGSNGYDNCNSISVDSNENVYSGGYFGEYGNYLGASLSQNIIAFDTIILPASNFNRNLFIAKFDSLGNVLWAKNNSTGSSGEIISVYSDMKNTFAIGYFYGSSIFEKDTLLSKGSSDVLVLKFNSAGNILYAKSYGGAGSDDGRCITTDKKGNTYISGLFTIHSIDFDSIVLKNISGADLFVAKILTNDTLRKFVFFCPKEQNLTIKALSGYNYYTWSDQNEKVIGYFQEINISNPIDSAVYTCKFKDTQDSLFTIIYTLVEIKSIPDFSYSLTDCRTNTIQFNNLSITNQGSLSYLWDFGDGITSTDDSPVHIYTTVGVHTVSLLVTNAESGCTSSINKNITWYPKPSIKISGDSTICNGSVSILKAAGGKSYQWSTGSIADSIIVTTGQKVWVVGYSASGCVSDTTFKTMKDNTPTVTITGDSTYCKGSYVTLKVTGATHYKWYDGTTADSIRVSRDTIVWVIGYNDECVSDTIKYVVRENPDFQLGIEGSQTLCAGDSTSLTAFGADTYYWSTGESTESITINKPGVYYVMGRNERGCEKKWDFNIGEVNIPSSDFTVSPLTIDSRNNKISCRVITPTGAAYLWDMGDGSSEHGEQIEHAYQVSDISSDYQITLTVTNSNGCISSSSQIIDVTLFIPNVFSPNVDGVNDIFMPGVDLEIISRNGVTLYKGTAGWDGNYNGNKMPDDTYYYAVSYSDKNRQTQVKKGYIILIR